MFGTAANVLNSYYIDLDQVPLLIIEVGLND